MKIVYKNVPFMVTESGRELMLKPGSGKQVSIDEWLDKVAAWRERNKVAVAKISVEEYLATKHAEVAKGLE